MNEVILSAEWAELAGAIVVQLLWQGAIVGAFAAIALRLARRRSPSTRYLIACTGLAVTALLLPANYVLLQRHAMPKQLHVTQGFSFGAETTSPIIEPRLDPVSPVIDARIQSAPKTSEVARDRAAFADWYHQILPWIGQCWVFGIVLIGIYDVVSLLAIRRMRAASKPVEDEIIALAEQVKQRLGVTARVQVRWLADITTAMLTGWFHLIILLPASIATRMPPEQVEAILAHELAHARRWDTWINAFQRIAEALLFFHPCVWWLSRRIRAERELCCDEIALKVFPDRACYVRALLNLASYSQQADALAVASHGGNLVERVHHILLSRNHGTSTKRGRIAAAAIALGAVTLPVVYSVAPTVAEITESTESLAFPDISVGAIQSRRMDSEYLGDSWRPGHDLGWSIVGNAQGVVSLPENSEIKLTTADNNLDYLYNLEPNSIYYLDCRKTGLTDDDVVPIATLTGLRALDLGDNRMLSGAAFQHLTTLENLEWLGFDLTLTAPAGAQDGTQNNTLAGLPPDALLHYPNLRFFTGHFDDYPVAPEYADDLLRQLASLQQLQYVSIIKGRVSSDGLAHFSGKRSLKALALKSMKLTDDVFETLKTLPNLEYLDLSENSSLTDEALKHLAGFPRLTHLNLEDCGITDSGLRYLASNQALESVNLSRNALTEICLESLLALPNLRSAMLVQTQVPEDRVAEFNAALARRPGYVIWTQQSTNPDAPKVGIVMSHFTATGPSWIGKPYRYSGQASYEAANALSEANFDVYAVIEPGTEHSGELSSILRNTGLTEKTIDGFNPAAIQTLDVVFTLALSNARTEMLSALTEAVQAGTGMVNIGTLGVVTPGVADPYVEEVTGLSNSAYHWRGFSDAECYVTESHELIPGLKPGERIMINVLNGVLSNTGKMSDDITVLMWSSENYPALYLRQHGNGRIVRAQWFRRFQPGMPYPGYTFYIRALNWAAQREVDATW